MPKRLAQIRERICNSLSFNLSTLRWASRKSSRTHSSQVASLAAGRCRSSSSRAEGSSAAALPAAARASRGSSARSTSLPGCTAIRDQTRLARDCPEKACKRGSTRGSTAVKKSATCIGRAASCRARATASSSLPPAVATALDRSPHLPKLLAVASATEESSWGLKVSSSQMQRGSRANTAACVAWCRGRTRVRAQSTFASCWACSSRNCAARAALTKNSS
mmetsp:Transcript_63837/g.177080  ORF Transcript_63837/g.177080 Transcript_63837/m.177080 type:complete len:221 (-) Transcript_63837:47-709(-)